VPSKKIAILISGRGSNMVALIDACRRGEIDATPIVISNKTNAAGLDRARERDVKAIVRNATLGYMYSHQRIKGELSGLPDSIDWDVSDPFYKGGVVDFFHTADED